MLTKDFYNILDKELTSILEKHKDDSVLKKAKGAQAANLKKSYALLIWFLEFYAKKTDYLPYITDSTWFSADNQLVLPFEEYKESGKDIDASCDIVLDIKDSAGKTVFYIVQTKWSADCEKELSSTEVAASLANFETILRGDISNVNEKLKQRLNELYAHLKNNGEVKFVFLSLCKNNPKTQELTDSFIANHRKTGLEILDIQRLKVDYIDRTFKRINPSNPLARYYNPRSEKVTLNIAKKGNFITIEKPFDAYVLLVRPSAIVSLFERYNFLLFFKNVRNPLLESDFNKDIEKTAKDESQFFWYFNNGITAITYAPFPDLRKEAETVELNGLQIINGAQTVYSLYSAYSNASEQERLRMDDEILITLRLLRSGGESFDLKVTRYTNSQNPVLDRDFCANDEIQERLQIESYNTNHWYEKRRGEFRNAKIEGVQIVPNEDFVAAYLAYHLQEPEDYLETNMFFISHKEHPKGLYEKIFNKNTYFKDMLLSYLLRKIILKKSYTERIVMPFLKIVFKKYISKKNDRNINTTEYLLKLLQKGDEKIVLKIISYLKPLVEKEFGVIENDTGSYLHSHFFFNIGIFHKLKSELEETDLDIEAIDNIQIPD